MFTVKFCNQSPIRLCYILIDENNAIAFWGQLNIGTKINQMQIFLMLVNTSSWSVFNIIYVECLWMLVLIINLKYDNTIKG